MTKYEPRSSRTEMPRRHTIISGTGRAGTTFLVQLLTALGLDTGFPDSNTGIYAECNAGMEWDIRHPEAPYIVKSPFLCDYLEELLRDERVSIDHAILPIRDLFAAAESRRDVVRRNHSEMNPTGVPGGLWHTDDPDQQEAVLMQQLYKIIHAISRYEIPLTLLYFPRFVLEPEYLYRKLNFLFPATTYAEFCEVHARVSRPELVHNFEP